MAHSMGSVANESLTVGTGFAGVVGELKIAVQPCGIERKRKRIVGRVIDEKALAMTLHEEREGQLHLLFDPAKWFAIRGGERESQTSRPFAAQLILNAPIGIDVEGIRERQELSRRKHTVANEAEVSSAMENLPVRVERDEVAPAEPPQ